jgi:hypothetical protein
VVAVRGPQRSAQIYGRPVVTDQHGEGASFEMNVENGGLRPLSLNQYGSAAVRNER